MGYLGTVCHAREVTRWVAMRNRPLEGEIILNDLYWNCTKKKEVLFAVCKMTLLG